jgi:DNA polymerase-3 subunit epsilon
MYAIIDIETTGGNPKTDKITEIAVLIHDGQKVIREFSSLINPECKIPYHISALTGITNEMVAEAPRFFEIARELVEITADNAFVAHNVSFDYNFVRSEFRRLGYEFKREQLCTVRLSRKLIPGYRSYSLGRLCDDLNIPVNGRHRAMGDAMATARLFDLLLSADSGNQNPVISSTNRIPNNVHPGFDISILRKLPEEPGVYYFYNQETELIYIGKSKNIRQRVLSHFANNSTGKAMQMREQITDIGFETTGNELIALLQESFEIKLHKPLYNRAQRRTLFQYGLYTYNDSNGYIRFFQGKTSDQGSLPLMCFTTKVEAKGFLMRIIDKYTLCQKLCGMYPTGNHCFHYEIGACHGACTGKEPPAEYNHRAGKVIEKYRFENRNMLIIDTGRNIGERSVIKIENGMYFGYGYFDMQFAETDQAVIHDCIKEFPDNRDVQHIIRQYLRNNAVEKLVVY